MPFRSYVPPCCISFCSSHLALLSITFYFLSFSCYSCSQLDFKFVDYADIIDSTAVLKDALKDPEELEAYVRTVVTTILFRVHVTECVHM